MPDSSTLSTEVIVSLVLGIPSLLVAGAGLAIAYLTYTRSREPNDSPPATHAIPSWHAHHHYHVQHSSALPSWFTGSRGSAGMASPGSPATQQLQSRRSHGMSE